VKFSRCKLALRARIIVSLKPILNLTSMIHIVSIGKSSGIIAKIFGPYVVSLRKRTMPLFEWHTWQDL